MTATLEKIEGLEYRLSMVIAGGDLKDKVVEKTRGYQTKIRLPGFRPNKPIPISVINKRFGSAIKEEAQSELMQQALEQAIEAHDLALASQPEVSDVVKQDDESVSFQMTFEQFPAIKLVKLDTLKVTRPQTTLPESQVDLAIAKMLKNEREWEAVDEPAAAGHRLRMDVSAVDAAGQPVPRIQAEDVEPVMGEKDMLEDIEKHLLGKMAGDTVEFPLTFPEDYHLGDLRGEAVTLTVTIHEVSRGKEPELNEAFFAAVGSGAKDEASFREEVRNMLQEDLDKKLRTVLKRNVTQSLIDAHDFELPKGIVKEETHRFFNMAQRGHLRLKGNLLVAAVEHAKRHVRLQLLLRALMNALKIELDADRLDAHIRGRALPYVDTDLYVKWVYSQEEQLDNMRAEVIEEQLYDAVIEAASLQDQTLSMEELHEQLHAD